MVLLVILLVGAALRMADLRRSPPGLNQDEAANAWNAYCLLKTGQDQFGVRWPIFYSRFFGENRSTLFMYALMPFQAVGGLNIWTARLPCAVGGVLTLLLIYYVGTRLFGRGVGLSAAGLMALNPWHIQQCRWGHEGGLAPFLVVAPLAAWLWANLPLDDDDTRRPIPWRAALAGTAAGISCYGYPAVRMFLPVFLTLAVAATWPAWFKRLKTRSGAAAITALLLGGAATFGPLAWKHLTDPAIGKRGQTTWVWKADDPPGAKVKAVLERYASHFGPDFLFIKGDHYVIQSPPGMGMFDWYMPPLMLLGLGAAIRRVRASRAARLLLLWVILYPLGDCLSEHLSAHAIRSLPGLGGLILLAALGLVTGLRWLWSVRPTAALAAAGLLAVAAVGLNVRFLVRFFGEYNAEPAIYHLYHVDLIEAAEWLRPRWETTDAVFCTATAVNQPYSILLVALGYDPHQWFQDQRESRHAGPWDFFTRVGKMYFMYDGGWANATIRSLRENGRHDRVVFIVRPDEGRGLPPPVKEIRRPDGQVVLRICQVEI